MDYSQSTSIRSLDNTLEEFGITPEMVSAASNAVGLGEMTADELLTKGGEGLSWLFHQDEAYGNQSPYGNAPGTSGRGGEITPNPITENTVSGMTPQAANISTVIPTNISASNPREAQNYNLSNMPKVQAAVNALKAGGANIMQGGKSAIDAIRQSGGLDSMLSGDISKLVEKVAPELSPSLSGIQNLYNQSLSGAGSLIDNAMSTGSGAMQSLKDSASQLSTSAGPMIGSLLENMGIADKKTEIQSASNQMAIGAQSSGIKQSESRAPLERGSVMMEGQGTPMEIRNPESSIRRLTDMIISYSFG
jgi:hypothetical protein